MKIIFQNVFAIKSTQIDYTENNGSENWIEIICFSRHITDIELLNLNPADRRVHSRSRERGGQQNEMKHID